MRMTDQSCILILGMHRSGTSALAGTLELLDVEFGSDLMGPTQYNLKGYFENNRIYELNKKLLTQFESSWDDVFQEELVLPNAFDFSELTELLKSEYLSQNRTFAIKDPRLVFLFPVYQKALTELGIDIKVAIPTRNPMEVARSLQKRDGFSLEKGLLLWSIHFMLAEKVSRGLPRVFISFDALIENPEAALNTISTHLDLDFAVGYAEKKNLIGDFLDPSLKAQNFPEHGEMEGAPGLVKSICSLIPRANSENLEDDFNQLRKELFDYRKFFYNQNIRKSLKQNEQLKINAKVNDAKLSRFAHDLESRDSQIDQLQQNLAARDSQIGQLQQDLAARDSQIGQLQQDLASRDSQIGQLQQDLASRDDKLEQLQYYLKIKMKELDKTSGELSEIHASTLWKIRRAIRKFGTKLHLKKQR
jgi:hypothetical protein